MYEPPLLVCRGGSHAGTGPAQAYAFCQYAGAAPGRVTAYVAGVNEGHGHGQFPEKYAKFAYDCGFAVPNFAPCHGENVENHTAEAHCSTLRCAVQGGGEPVVMGCDPNTSLYFTNVHLPEAGLPA